MLFDFVRRWSRRAPSEDPALADQGRLVVVAEAVRTLTDRGAATTVTAIAREIGIDQSGASRLLQSATQAGYLVVEVSAADGRRREAALTPAGRTMLEQAHRWQESAFAQLSAGWSEVRRRDFQRAMTELMQRSYELDDISARQQAADA